MVARYTSLLPLHLKHFETTAHLLFYPFITMTASKEKTRYNSLTLSKRRHRMPVQYSLTNQELREANEIRHMLCSYLSLTSPEAYDYTQFSTKAIEFISRSREEIIEEERWQ
jgi:hypothetical protein